MGSGYATFSGTSMASPHVAGVAVLTLSAGLTDLNGSGYANDEVRAVLQTSAQDLGAAGRDPLFGFGLVDASAAVFCPRILVAAIRHHRRGSIRLLT